MLSFPICFQEYEIETYINHFALTGLGFLKRLSSFQSVCPLPCIALKSLGLVAGGDFFYGYKIGRRAQVSDSLSFVPKGAHGLQG